MAYWTATEIVGPGGTNFELRVVARAWERIYATRPTILRLHVAAFRSGTWLLRRYLGLRN